MISAAKPLSQQGPIKSKVLQSSYDKKEASSRKLAHALFEAQAAATPDAIALQYEQSQYLSYQQLNDLANFVARQLVCGRGSIIPIFLERSVNLVIALLAVLKTGAAYTLVSPESPAERTKFIVEDSRAPFIIVDKATQGTTGVANETHIEDLLQGASRAPQEHLGNLEVHQSPTEIAYVIYTSGSTGRPKGVLLSHRAVTTGLTALPRPEVPEKLRTLLSHSPAFSAAQRSILGTLVRGGTLCLASKENVTSWILQTVKALDVSSLEITPSMLQLLNPSELPETIKTITLGGEPAGSAVINSWAGKAELYNGYGISECTQLNMRSRIFPGQQHPLLGKPTDETVAYILRPGTLSPAPVDEPGELCLGGDQIAEGYLNLPLETEKTFIPNIFGRGRLCRTGDLVVLREDGSMVHLGRIDRQIKVDGQRVDPNAPNNMVQIQPFVHKSCVLAAVIRGRKSLVATIVPTDDAPEWKTLVKDVKQAVRDQIEAYAVPRYWVKMTDIPVNPNGKTDVKKLTEIIEAMDENEVIGQVSGEGNGHLDTDVREMLGQILSMSPNGVNADANFQELGGSSLDAIVLSSKARSIGFHLEVPDLLEDTPLHEVFGKPRGEAVGPMGPPDAFSLLPDNAPVKKTDDIEDAYPVTPLQEGVLADTMLGNANHVYQRVYKIQGKTQVDQIKEVLNLVVQKSPILRTTFKPWKRSFVQTVKKFINVPWKTMSGDLNTALKKLQGQPLEIGGPMLRATVLGSDTLILEMHHSLFDYWSSQFVFADMVAILKGNDAISRAPFSPYVAYQQNRTKDPADKEFWQKYLGSAAETTLELPGTNADGESFALNADLGDALHKYSQGGHVTVGSAIHQAWAFTLAKYVGQNDVLYMTATSGRDADVDGVLTLNGPTLCTVPFRTSLDKSLGASASAHGKDVQNTMWDISKHGHIGFRNAMAAASLKPTHLNTMVNVITKLEEVDAESPLAPIIAHGDNFTQYVTLEVDESHPKSAKLLVPFSADVSGAQDLLNTFVSTVKKMAKHPDISIGSLIGHEKEQKTAGIKQHWPEFSYAHSAFEKHAHAEPHRVAIKTKHGVVSYGEMNARAERFAHYLAQSGVKAGDMVPLFMDKSDDTLVAIFGILKAGAAFVPLSSHNPHERNKFIVEDINASIIITDKETKADCEKFELPMILAEDVPRDGEFEREPVTGLTPNSTAYIIFTSGSTGTPKGVLVPHSAVDASSRGMIEATNVTKDWCALWVLNYIFDASYYDVFTTLSAGASLCVIPQDDILSNLTGVINDMGVEQVMLTPTITKFIRGGPSDVPRLKVLNVCGEKIDTNILEWSKKIDVYNGYGPTEATILMTVSKVEPEGNLNSIGSPMKYVEAIILPAEGESLVPVKDGEIGELCVSGPQLAKGYLNRPEQTQKAFIRDANDEPLYRTGDLAKWAEDGSLLCLGRKDYQIKLNGFRIELGEIENTILSTNKVDATVVSVAQVMSKPQLVAFCIFNGDHKSSDHKPLPGEDRRENVEELTNSLHTLAHYMMPSVFIPFNSFPTLPSGKANRKELVALVESMKIDEVSQYLPNAPPQTEFVPVSTDKEVVMQEAWASVLDLPEESIGASSLFLSLGGDSIAAINVVAHCRSCGYDVSVGQLLSNPTLAEQAACMKVQKIREKTKIEYITPESLIEAVEASSVITMDDIEEVYPCGPGQIEFLTQGVKDEQFWNLTASRFLPEDFDLNKWKDVTRGLTAENQILRAFYFLADKSDPSSWQQVTLKEPVLNWEEKEVATEEERMQALYDLRDGRFEFGKPAVNYLVLHSKVDGVRTLAVKVDHATYDGTLLRIFDSQFLPLARGETELPKIDNFKNYIDWLQREDREEHLEYWTSLLQSYQPPTIPNLPTQTMTDKLKFAPVKADVDPIAEKFGVTTSTLFQGSYAIVAGKLTGTRDVLVDNLLTGRNANVEDPQLLNGTCANFLPFRTNMDNASIPVMGFLKDVQNMFWDTTEAGTVGINDIYRALGKDRDENSAKLLYCFQPFTPPPPGTKVNHMRWVVMAQSKVFMNVNYALMVEVQKTATGYRLKLQWDSRVFSEEAIDGAVENFEAIFKQMEQGPSIKLDSLLSV
ncbi:hypothetical protein GGR52DRAFT_575533 [Hypoxylon sp. FL1284]|nr:hypothetical protein GGR52DRAFT_575533 [Hypoxylon sp. FL1284]